jgi:hypothetical protein
MDNLQTATRKLLSYCRAHDWAGYDPYDALNSKLFETLPFLRHSVPQIIFTQALRRSPVNLRRLMLIPKTQNPKALGLFLAALLKLPETEVTDREILIDHMIERLIALRSADNPYWCWGYSFPWQGRAMLVPAGAPNLVSTVFVADALFDAYEQRQDLRCLNMAVNAAEYIRDVLYWQDNDKAGFSYPLPTVRGTTHNANLLAAALLCRAYRHTGEKKFLGPAFTVARYSVGKQRSDGSWWYGEAPTQKWIDNFHTGYNLCALQNIGRYAETDEFDSAMRRGFEFYRAHFFRADGAAKYFHNKAYPLDVHSVAQSILTLLAFRDLDPESRPLADSVYGWAMKHMWDERGFFYYRVLRLCTIRTSYMRWSQAWMLLALATLLSESGESARELPARDTSAFAKV